MMNLEALDLVARDYIGIFVGGIAYYALGALWYTVLFGKRWIAATGRTMEEFPKSSPAWMALTLIGGVVSTVVIAAFYQWGGGDGIVDGMAAGAIIGVGVVAMEMLKEVVYNFDSRKHAWSLYIINTTYAVIGFTVAGMVYGFIAAM
ncbi:MAG: DUF1761 domain-containing protein [Chloroflexi bacterium]|nr:DUF1761 domain-containing protein [Chloroflexota bacterium]